MLALDRRINSLPVNGACRILLLLGDFIIFYLDAVFLQQIVEIGAVLAGDLGGLGGFAITMREQSIR